MHATTAAGSTPLLLAAGGGEGGIVEILLLAEAQRREQESNEAYERTLAKVVLYQRARDERAAPQYVIAGERAAVPKSTALDVASARSLNPPLALSATTATVVNGLANRLVIAIAMGVHSGELRVERPGDRAVLAVTPPLSILLRSFLPSAQAHHVYRFYFAFADSERLAVPRGSTSCLPHRLLSRVALK